MCARFALGLTALALLAPAAFAAEPVPPFESAWQAVQRIKREVAAEAPAIAGDPDRESWEPRLRDLLAELDGRAGFRWPAVAFEQVELLREKLALMAKIPDPGRGNDAWRGSREASLLLALYDDPRDAEFRIRAGRAFGLVPVKKVRSAPTAEAALALWRDDHFGTDGGPHTFNTLEVLARTDDRALGELYVRYAHWGYSVWVTLRREGGRWVVRRQMDGVRQHFRP